MDWIRPRKLEFALLIGLIGFAAVALFQALGRMSEEAEESAVQAETAALRVELLDRLAHRELYGGALPESRNPLLWVARRPNPYLGEIDTAPSQGGVWYFDRSREELVYRFHSGREARFCLVRGADLDKVPAGLSGIGLRRLDSDR